MLIDPIDFLLGAWLMRLATVLTTLLAIFLMSPADAARKAGVTMPDALTVAGKRLTLNGMGLREATFLKVDVYVAGLYVEQPSSNPGQLVSSEQTKLLMLEFVRDVDRKDIVKAWNDGFRGNATVSLDALQPKIDQLNSWMTGFKDGQTLVFTYIPGQGVLVDIDNVRKGVIEGADFAESLFSIWLGPKPPGGDLKRGLLGRH